MAFTDTEEKQIRATIEQARVRSVIDCYAHCMDTGDWDLAASIFTDDAVFEFHATPSHATTKIGGSAIAAYLRDRNRLFKTKTCFVCHAHITITGDTALSDTFAISNVGIDDRIAIRGLRYRDELVRGTDGNWRFRLRVHQPLWQHYAAAVTPGVPPT